MGNKKTQTYLIPHSRNLFTGNSVAVRGKMYNRILKVLKGLRVTPTVYSSTCDKYLNSYHGKLKNYRQQEVCHTGVVCKL